MGVVVVVIMIVVLVFVMIAPIMMVAVVLVVMLARAALVANVIAMPVTVVIGVVEVPAIPIRIVAVSAIGEGILGLLQFSDGGAASSGTRRLRGIRLWRRGDIAQGITSLATGKRDHTTGERG